MSFSATTARSWAISSYGRLDANFYTSPGVAAYERVSLLEAAGHEVQTIGSIADKVWDPSRFARVYATSKEPAVDYLRPYDVFDYLPTASDRLSLSRNTSVSDLQLKPGTLLQTCSGRNLGPLALVDDDLAAFALSHDMIRIEVGDIYLRHYVLAFLQTPTGQSLLRRSMSGSVIDHLTVQDVGKVPIPILRTEDVGSAVAAVERAYSSMQAARKSLRRLVRTYAEKYPVSRSDENDRRGWTVPSTLIDGRLDAAFYAPSITQVRENLRRYGAHPLRESARAIKPPRYKRYYVDQGNGRPVLSGRQLLQVDPINLRFVSDRSFRDSTEYVLHTGMTIFGGVGRAEGRLGSPALVTSRRAGWLASEDVVRLAPLDGVSAGSLWLATATPQVQAQLKSLTFGSVVDHLAADDVASILLPPVADADGEAAEEAWLLLGSAEEDLQSALGVFETTLDRV